MLKKMSVVLLAASILAAPALAAGPAKTDASAKTEQNKTEQSKWALTTNATTAKTNEVKPTVGKSKGKPHASMIRHKHRHYAHVRHHKKVSPLHASVKAHAPKAKLGFSATGHKKAVQKLSFKRTTPASRRG